MIDRQKAFNSQISDFLAEYKHRFSNVNHSGMPGKVGYSTKLNTKEGSTMTVYLSEYFPLNAPIVYIYPKLDSPYVDDLGRVKDNCLSYWNVNSTLVNAIRSLLIKFEIDNPDLGISSSKLNTNTNSNNNINLSNFNFNNTGNNNNNNNNTYNNNFGNTNYNGVNYNTLGNNNNNVYNNNFSTSTNNNNNIINSSYTNNNNSGLNNNQRNISPVKKTNNIYSDLNSIYSKNTGNLNTSYGSSNSNTNNTNSLESDLSSKSIEELVYIYLNQDDYINEFMIKYKEPTHKLKLEVDKLFDDCKEKKHRYDKEMKLVTETLDEFNTSKKLLTETSYEKIKVDNKYTVDNLLDKLNNDLSKTNNIRQKVISEFLSKKIDYDEFIKAFKEPSVKIHWLNISKEKLYQLKNTENNN